MDDFNRSGMHQVGIGGIKCQCCFDYNSTRGKKYNFSKVRRSRLKRQTIDQVWEEIQDNPDIARHFNDIKIK